MVLLAWFRSPRYLLALFMAATLLPALSLGWLAWIGLAELDRQSARDALDAAASRVASDVRQRLDVLSRELPALARSPEPSLPADAVLLVVDGENIVERPGGRLLFDPQLRPSYDDVARSPALDAPAALERQGNWRAAAAAFRRAADTDDRSARAAALIGLARCLRRDGRPREALAVYDRLAELGAHQVLDAPAVLVARRARCAVLAELGSPDLPREARALYDDLVRPSWRLDRSGFEEYLSWVEPWLSPATAPDALEMRRALTEAVTDVTSVRSRVGDEPDRGWLSIRSRDLPFVIVWQNTGTFTALLMGPSWLADQATAWTTDSLTVRLVDERGRVTFGDAERADEGVIARTADTGLPWTIEMAHRDPASVPSLLARSRYLLLGGFLAAGMLFVAGGVLVTRALSRELAVARLQSDFVAAVSHEFRSPLTSMKHLLEMLRDDAVPGPDRRQRYYQVLNRETDRLRRLVEDLLDFGRMEAGKAGYRFERVDIRTLVQEVAAEFQSGAEAGGRLVVSAGGPAVPVMADREAVTRAVRNLVDNAAKYSPETAPIELEVQADSAAVWIRVHDHGPGIPPAEQKRIFAKFYRGETATPAGIRGTGLGLATVLRLVQAHRGSVRVDSRLGEGSTFTIELPIAEEAV
jgi:signal transduction histidine kinase